MAREFADVSDARAVTENPFFVLECAPETARGDIERAGQKLLGLLEIGAASARTYRSPLGVHQRTSDLVRAALAELRDPDKRLVHELWASAAPRPPEAPSSLLALEPLVGWDDR